MAKGKLTPKQKMFCKNYAIVKEFYGSGLYSYADAYGFDPGNPTQNKTCRENASKLLDDPKICERINELLDKNGFNDEFADKQLLHLMAQHQDRKSKLGALKEYNNLKKRTSNTLQLNHNVQQMEEFTNALKKIANGSGTNDNQGGNGTGEEHSGDNVQG